MDILCVGHACYDLIFQVPHHPAEDEKLSSVAHLACGGGPAANAAIAIARLGLTTGFIGYLGNDLYGDSHLAELTTEGIDTHHIHRGSIATPVATLIVKPDGKRSVINYTQASTLLPADYCTLMPDQMPKVLLVDGHQPAISLALIKQAKQLGIVTILDAGSLHSGTRQLMTEVDFLAASEKFAHQLSKQDHPETALKQMRSLAPSVIITLGERGLIWSHQNKTGNLPAYSVKSIDSTGAGDAFHGGLAAALARQLNWIDALKYASAVGALCCTTIGARPGMPTWSEVDFLLRHMSTDS
ncbi:MAG TPA: carbohydrate kinase [Crenotrichaceae bacterium]|nr:carbohydrate kinase [Crenotrichaceae bacterium]